MNHSTYLILCSLIPLTGILLIIRYVFRLGLAGVRFRNNRGIKAASFFVGRHGIIFVWVSLEYVRLFPPGQYKVGLKVHIY